MANRHTVEWLPILRSKHPLLWGSGEEAKRQFYMVSLTLDFDSSLGGEGGAAIQMSLTHIAAVDLLVDFPVSSSVTQHN